MKVYIVIGTSPKYGKEGYDISGVFTSVDKAHEEAIRMTKDNPFGDVYVVEEAELIDPPKG